MERVEEVSIVRSLAFGQNSFGILYRGTRHESRIGDHAGLLGKEASLIVDVALTQSCFYMYR
jgi:hypothetical protein